MENNEVKEQNCHKGAGKKHRWMMLLCCLLPILAVGFALASGTKLTGNYLMLLICPLMHIGMMFMMGKDKSCH